MRTNVTRPLTSTLFATSGATVTITVDGALAVPLPSDTVRLKVSAVFVVTVGAVNVALTELAPLSVTAVPPVCVHVYWSASPSGSTLASPLRRTLEPATTVRAGPAFAVSAGPAGGAVTVMTTLFGAV